MPRPSEDEIIARHFAPLAGRGAFGLRDDAALATPRPGHDLVITKDVLVAGVHFFADDPPDAIARKALRVNLSDLAAKAARPIGFLLGLGLPADWTERWLAAFCSGLGDDARAYGCPLLGGDTVAMPGPLTLSITALGEVETGGMVPRTGARAGDLVYVTGTIGDAALGLRVRQDLSRDAGWHADLGPRACGALLARHRQPEPRLAMCEALRAHARAAMDVSDGFLGDLEKMLRLEGLTIELMIEDVPLSAAVRAAIDREPSLVEAALTGGDDYEIICAIAPGEAVAFEQAAVRTQIPVHRIGIAITGEGPAIVRDKLGGTLTFGSRRFQHFA